MIAAGRVGRQHEHDHLVKRTAPPTRRAHHLRLPDVRRSDNRHRILILAFPPEVRRVIYTTDAIEALNRQLRKAIKTKGHFPNEEAARELIYLAITNAVPQWTRTRNWTTALLAFKIHFGDRLPD
jgi:transposase-like protein